MAIPAAFTVASVPLAGLYSSSELPCEVWQFTDTRVTSTLEVTDHHQNTRSWRGLPCNDYNRLTVTLKYFIVASIIHVAGGSMPGSS